MRPYRTRCTSRTQVWIVGLLNFVGVFFYAIADLTNHATEITLYLSPRRGPQT